MGKIDKKKRAPGNWSREFFLTGQFQNLVLDALHSVRKLGLPTQVTPTEELEGAFLTLLKECSSVKTSCQVIYVLKGIVFAALRCLNALAEEPSPIRISLHLSWPDLGSGRPNE